MEVALGTIMSGLLLLWFTIGCIALVVLSDMGSQVSLARELLVAASTRVDGASCVVRHVNTQLMKVDK